MIPAFAPPRGGTARALRFEEGYNLKRMIVLALACLLLIGQSSLAETAASIGTDGRLIVPGGEDGGIGENVQSIVAQTGGRVYFTEGSEEDAEAQGSSLWVYADGSAQRVSDIDSNAVYAQKDGTIYFLLPGDVPQLMSLDVSTGEMTAVPGFDLSGVTLNEPEIALEDGGIVVYTVLDSGDRVVAATQATPQAAATETAVEPDQNLSRGSNGEEVRSLQERLAALDYPVGAQDGVFGYRTHQAVRYFQDALDITQTGVVTPELKEQIFADGASEYHQYVSLDRGSHGIRVEALQARLRALYYTTDPVDGDYGSRTADAVRLFQQKAGLSQTGAASVETLKALMAKSAPSYSGYAPLKKGDSGSRVKKLKERLYKLGYYAGERGNLFTSQTVNAVKLFQKTIGVKQTGMANVKLQKRLYASKAPKCKEYIELKYGNTGTRVKELQKRLKALGYYDGKIGGHFRSETRTAVKAFQKAINVKQSGSASVSLQKKLFADDAPTATP
jgi:peptidoglycan hydrolase-like protein with peptidoglycan-binding domain